MQRLRFVLAFFLVVSSFPPAAAQQILSVVSAANSQPLISPNSLATIYGANLAQGTASAPASAAKALPTALAGTSVSVGGETAPLLYVSPQQINFLVPANIPIGAATIIVKLLNSEQSASGNASVALVAPGLFTVPCLRPSRGAILNGVTYSLEPFQTVTSQNPSADKRTRLSLFGTGLRYGAPNSTTVQATDSLGFTRSLPVEYAGPAPDFFGLDQVNVVLPAALEGAGLVNLKLTSGNAISNSVSVVLSQPVAPGVVPGQSFNIMTVAGSGVAGNAGDNGSAIAAALDNPTGVVLDKNHNLYIASGAGHTVRMVSPDGVITTIAGTGVAGSSGDGGPAMKAQLRAPVSLAIDAAGNLYIADHDDNKIRRIAANGIISTFAGTGIQGFSGDSGPAAAAQISSPSAVALDPFGALLIADTGNNRLRRVTSDGIIDTMAGTGTPGLSGDGGAGYLAALNLPGSVAVGADGTTYIADEGNQRIRRLSSDGNISSLLGNNSLPLTFQSPVRIAVDANQQLFVADSPNARIQVMGSACQLNSIAGTGTPGFAGDGGPATAARINGPASLAPDPSGDIFFADTNNNLVRRLYQGDCQSPAAIFFDPAPAMAGSSVNGLFRLSCPASQATTLALSTSGSGLPLPSSVKIASGQTSGTFSFLAPSVATPSDYQLVASNPTYSATGTLNVDPSATDTPGALSMTLAPNPQIAGGPVTGRVTFPTPAPAGGIPVSLTSDNPLAKVANMAVIPEGQTSGEFVVVTSPSSEPTTATITGSAAGLNGAASVSLLPGSGSSTGLATISGLSLSPPSITSGQTATGTVSLASAAPSGDGVQVGLSSNNANVTVPASVAVPSGQTTATFPVSTAAISFPTTATITASSANTASATLSVNPASSSNNKGTIASLSVSPSSVTSGQSATGTVTLASAAPSGGVQVGLSSSNAAAVVPASFTVPQGQTTATFPVSTSPVSSPTTATISASSANTAAATLSVNPASTGNNQGTIASFSVSPSSVTAGQGATGTVTLSSAAPSGGVQVGLSSNNAAATVPGSVTIPSGQTTASFPVTTSTVSSATTATITAASANSASATLTVNPAAASADCVGSISLSRSQVIGGNTVGGTVTLMNPAPAGGQPVNLSSSSASAGVPTQVTVPPGQNSTNFTVTTKPVLSTDNPLISASTGACASSSALLTVLPPGL